MPDILYETIERGRQGVAEGTMKRLNRANRRLQVKRLISKPVAQEQQPPGRKVRFRLNLLVTISRQCMSIIAKHRIVMPGKKTMPNLVRLIPSMLLLR
jgi:hypothetical protein